MKESTTKHTSGILSGFLELCGALLVELARLVAGSVLEN